MASTMNTFTNSYMQTGSVDYNGFRAWTSKHHYRTSSQDMTASVPIAAKTYAIPGYSGYIPGASDTPIEKTFTLNSRELQCFLTNLIVLKGFLEELEEGCRTIIIRYQDSTERPLFR